MFNILILIPSGGIESPYIWYSLNTIFVALIVFRRKAYCWLNLFFYLFCAIWVSDWILDKQNDIVGVLQKESNYILSLILITLALRILVEYNKKIEEKNISLKTANDNILTANKKIKEYINSIMELYQAVHVLASQQDRENLMDVILEYTAKITKSNRVFYINKNQHYGRDDFLCSFCNKNRPKGECYMRVLVVDDHPLVRKGIISALKFEQCMEDIQEASNVDEALSLLIRTKPEITMVDINLGKEDGLEVVSKARQYKYESKFIVLTSSSKREDFERAQNMDVDGYILKDAFTEDIIYALKTVNRGKKYYDPSIVQYKFDYTEKSLFNELTNRELDVLKKLGKGFSNRQIAKDLFISEHTVKKHVSAILGKLGLSHRTEAALLANRQLDNAQIINM